MALFENIDSVFPNFTIFVIVLTPIIILLLIISLIIEDYLLNKVKKKQKPKMERDIVVVLGYIPLFYLIAVIIEIIQYIYGMREDFSARLFGTHLENMTYFILVIGIMQALYIILRERITEVSLHGR